MQTVSGTWRNAPKTYINLNKLTPITERTLDGHDNSCWLNRRFINYCVIVSSAASLLAHSHEANSRQHVRHVRCFVLCGDFLVAYVRHLEDGFAHDGSQLDEFLAGAGYIGYTDAALQT